MAPHGMKTRSMSEMTPNNDAAASSSSSSSSFSSASPPSSPPSSSSSQVLLLPNGKNLFALDPDLAAHFQACRSKVAETEARWTAAGIIVWPYFKHLSQEVRDTIWGFAASATDSRVVEITSHAHDKTSFTSPTLVPALLHVCRDSRVAALRQYRPLSFGGAFTGTVIDYEKDIVFLNATNLPSRVFNHRLEEDDLLLPASSPFFDFFLNTRRLAITQQAFAKRQGLPVHFHCLREAIIVMELEIGEGAGALVACDQSDWDNTDRRRVKYLGRLLSDHQREMDDLEVVAVRDLVRRGEQKRLEKSFHYDFKKQAAEKRQKERLNAEREEADLEAAKKLQWELDTRRAE